MKTLILSILTSTVVLGPSAIADEHEVKDNPEHLDVPREVRRDEIVERAQRERQMRRPQLDRAGAPEGEVESLALVIAQLIQEGKLNPEDARRIQRAVAVNHRGPFRDREPVRDRDRRPDREQNEAEFRERLEMMERTADEMREVLESARHELGTIREAREHLMKEMESRAQDENRRREEARREEIEKHAMAEKRELEALRNETEMHKRALMEERATLERQEMELRKRHEEFLKMRNRMEQQEQEKKPGRSQ